MEVTLLPLFIQTLLKTEPAVRVLSLEKRNWKRMKSNWSNSVHKLLVQSILIDPSLKLKYQNPMLAVLVVKTKFQIYKITPTIIIVYERWVLNQHPSIDLAQYDPRSILSLNK
jgi:hypothetical protein